MINIVWKIEEGFSQKKDNHNRLLQKREIITLTVCSIVFWLDENYDLVDTISLDTMRLGITKKKRRRKIAYSL